MDILSVSALGCPAVPDASFPFGDELAELLDPPASPSQLDSLKLSALQGSCFYSAPAFYPPFPFDHESLPDWMGQDNLLPTPEEQEADFTAFMQQPAPPYSSFSLPTPDSSSPSTPASSLGQDPEILDALSFFDGSPASHVLPQFETQSPLPSPAGYSTPHSAYAFSVPPCDPAQGAFIPSPLALSTQDLSPDSSFSPTSSESPLPSPPSRPEVIDLTEAESIRDLLSKSSSEEEDPPTSSVPRERKSRSAPDPSTAGGPKGKRRKLTRTAKKERKKEQNKQAALRYRQRKRGEVEVVEERREELEAVNSDLKKQLKALQTEIGYLKNLWLEVEAVRARRTAHSVP